MVTVTSAFRYQQSEINLAASFECDHMLNVCDDFPSVRIHAYTFLQSYMFLQF